MLGLRRIDRRLWPPVLVATAVLATVLFVFADLPGAFWVMLAFRPLVFGCALWLVYECLRHLVLVRTRPPEVCPNCEHPLAPRSPADARE